MSEGMIVAVIVVIGLGIAAVLVATMVRAIVLERRSAGISRIWANFGLSISFLALFLLSWIEQAVKSIERRLDETGIGSSGAS